MDKETIEEEEYTEEHEAHEPSAAENVYDRRIKGKARQACEAFGIQTGGDAEYVRSSFKGGFVFGGFYALKNQWISVEEALPEYDKLVLVKHRPICSVPYEQNNMSFARREARSYGDVWIINRQTWRVNLNNRIDNTVTHWMPIPELKLDEEDDE